VDEGAVLELIAKTTLVGVLPAPHEIFVRRYVPNEHTERWFGTFLAGVVFLRNQQYALFDGTRIKLFVVPPVEDEFFGLDT